MFAKSKFHKRYEKSNKETKGTRVFKMFSNAIENTKKLYVPNLDKDFFKHEQKHKLITSTFENVSLRFCRKLDREVYSGW